jgi:DNA mismatch repair ATPase MutS
MLDAQTALLAVNTYPSIVWRYPQEEPAQPPAEPPCFRDVGLDQIVAAAVHGRSECGLETIYRTPLTSVDAVRWRQAIVRDLQRVPVRLAVEHFNARMRQMRKHLEKAGQVYNAHERRRWHLEAALVADAAAHGLQTELRAAAPQSAGLQAIQRHVDELLAESGWVERSQAAQAIAEDLAAVHYTIHIDGLQVTVRAYAGEVDYAAQIAQTFDRFRRAAAHDYLTPLTDSGVLNNVEGQILDRVALLFPEVFGRLQAFCEQHPDPADPTLARFDREVQFYLGYLDFIAPLRRAGLAVELPEVSADDRTVRAGATYDMALARRQLAAQQTVVTNDLQLADSEHLLVITGPNHGGKTTMARTIGQLHQLAALGLPVAGSDVRLPLIDRLFTHFEREEDVRNQRGKLQDDLVRLKQILQCVTPHGLVILNETFSSTTVDDAVLLARRVLQSLLDRGTRVVFVTFLTELSRFDAQTVSMVSTVDANDPTVRTFHVVRRAADGKSYAMALAEKYRVTEEQLRQRIPR